MNDATQQPEDANLENQEAKAPEAADQVAETASEAAPETTTEPAAEAAPAVEAAPEPTPTEPRELAKPTDEFEASMSMLYEPDAEEMEGTADNSSQLPAYTALSWREFVANPHLLYNLCPGLSNRREDNVVDMTDSNKLNIW